MNAYLGSIVLLVGSIALYQVAQRLLPRALNPWHALVVVYAVALALCVAATLLERGRPFGESLRSLNWAVPVVALAAVGIELGWILAFRSGWTLSTTGLLSQVGVTMLVVPVGLLFFRERLSGLNIAGVALCLLGLALATRR